MTNGTSSCFIDTNLLLYLKDRNDTDKRREAERWINFLASREALVISPQVVNEFVNVTTNKYLHVSRDELHEAVLTMEVWCKAKTNFETSLLAFNIRETMLIRWYDAVLLASALQAKCRFFLSEDLQHERKIGDMQILDPFKTDFTSFFATH